MEFATSARKLLPWSRSSRVLWTGKSRSQLDTECAAGAFSAPLEVDLYLFQGHELSMEPERITTVLRTILLDGLRGGSAGVSENLGPSETPST